MNDLLNTYTEVFVMTDADDNDVPPHFECSHCPQDVTEHPCPVHAPLGDLPGLRLIPCDAQPRHYVWAHQRDDYGLPCPWCLLNEHREREAEARQCRHRAWRRTRLFRWFSSWAYSMGVISGSCHSAGDGCDWYITLYWKGRRPYVLGASRETWRCWLKGRHRRGEEVGFGFCGKCVPWPCCGSQRVEHETGCAEADA